MNSIISAISLLTRIPMPQTKHSGKNIAWCYPIVGLLLGVIYGAILILISLSGIRLTAEVLSVLIIIMMAFLTGAFHFDGLADVADGFWGAYDKDKHLEIMSDSRIGAYGTIAIVCALLLYYSLFAELRDPVIIAIVLAVSSTISRGIMAVIQLTNPLAKKSGLLNSVSSGKNKWGQILFILLFVGVLVYVLSDEFILMIIFAVSFMIWGLLSILFRRKIGGVTGDCLGASQIISEIIILITIIGFV